ncbi:uncharacterized protein KY384_002225 [Bacidia gigantensis]|uniref:uncharacterized protein n=1 Tax=Bacidia gigantensis TaxID=2732470 RepID=UPI001D03A094|nr:uncharacterized protein KY384_002225 [Bacidia gigantensis]KAG8533442.1 hypothetical protein KY384_002225 [Bacidia gigantensis]
MFLTSLLLIIHRIAAYPAGESHGTEALDVLPSLANSYNAIESTKGDSILNGTSLSDAVRTELTVPYSIHNESLNADYECFPGKLYKTKRARTRDCLGAIMSLPSGHEVGQFHTGGVQDDHELPVKVHAPKGEIPQTQICLITVDIGIGETDESTWLVVTNRVKLLIDACAVGMYLEGRTGGTTTTGKYGRINITVEKSHSTGTSASNQQHAGNGLLGSSDASNSNETFTLGSENGGTMSQKVYGWVWHKKPLEAHLDKLVNAQTFEEWEITASQIDELLNTDLWRQNASSKYYDFRLIYERRKAIVKAREDEDILGLVNLLRSGLVRNLGNITAPKLFNRAYAGTKLLIEEYITQVALAIKYVTALPAASNYESGWTSQAKLDLLHDTRQAFGRSTLVLQGGGMFAYCHLGVVRALHLRGLLPRIITGTGTGALVAALVGIHPEDELLDFLNGKGIDITSFAQERKLSTDDETQGILTEQRQSNTQATLNRLINLIRYGRLLDSDILESCVREHVGDLTFEEAYARTKRVLNITIPTSGRGGVPNLLNYLTAPNVLISSAAQASSITTFALHQPLTLLCKDETGAITAWSKSHAQTLTFHPHRLDPVTASGTTGMDSPLSRIAELFNVNHFIVSQARPSLAPFLRTDLQHPSSPRQKRGSGLVIALLRLATGEVHHRLSQLDALGFLPLGIRRFLIDEAVPGANLTLVPDLRPTDLIRVIMEKPGPTSLSLPLPIALTNGNSDENRGSEEAGNARLEYWVRQGERSVWPNVCSLKIRCTVEVELDRCYQLVRRRKPLDAMGGGMEVARRRAGSAESGKSGNGNGNGNGRKRMRASSLGLRG